MICGELSEFGSNDLEFDVISIAQKHFQVSRSRGPGSKYRPLSRSYVKSISVNLYTVNYAYAAKNAVTVFS